MAKRKSPLESVTKLGKVNPDELMKQIAAHHAEREQDEKDKHALRGKYAPPVGTCGICGGKVVPDIGWPPSTRIGGPPLQAYVKNWYCEGCQVLYRKPPRATDPEEE